MSKRTALGLLLALALGVVASGLVAALAAAAEPLRIVNLRVGGGEANWHADNAFRLEWDQVSRPPAFPRAAIYRLYNSEGNGVAGPIREAGIVTRIEPVRVPTRPGVYTAEIRLEDDEGHLGPPAYAALRFDDAAPTAPAPVARVPWSPTREQALLEIGHPAGPAPLAGLRGYAVSLDDGSGSFPCAQARWCSPAETDLSGGIGDDEIALGPLPEGETFARVVAVSGSGVPSPVATALLRADGTAPLLTLQGLPSGWSDGPVHLTALASDPLSGMTAVGAAGPFTAISVDGDPAAISFGATASGWVTGSGTHTISYFARDAVGNVNDGRLGADPATAAVRIDEEPPKVSFAAAQDPAEPERIEAVVTDSLSGPSPDRGAIRLRRAETGAAFETLPTRVLGNRLVARWDSDSYPPGIYEFEATGYDRAGNTGVGRDRVHGGRMILVDPLKAPVTLEAGFGGRRLVWQHCSRSRRGRRCHRQRITSFDARPSTRTVTFGHSVRFGGRLQNAYGSPLGGLEATVVETFAGGAEPGERTTLVPTAPDGTFSLQLEPGPSRDVAVRFAGTRTLTRAATRSVHLGVLAAVRLRTSAASARVGGAPVVFSGSVDASGASGSEQGLPVELQFRYPGADWSEFRTVETDAHGRFRYAYRFSDDDSRGIRFQFRAYATGREGWPYEPAYSRPVAVTGR